MIFPRIYTVLFIILYSCCIGQTKKADSLKLALKNPKNDTATVNLLNKLSYEIYLRTEKSIGEVSVLFDSSIRVAERINFHRGLIDARLIGSNTLRNTGNVQKSIEYALPALELARKIKDSTRLFRSINTLGSGYMDEGNFKTAGEFFFEALHIAEMRNNKKMISSVYNSLGNLYFAQKDVQRSILYYLRSLPINIELNDKMRTSFSCVNLGKSYKTIGKFDSSVYYYNKALVIQTEQDNFVGQGYSYHGIGETYLQKGHPEAALDYFNRAYKLAANSEDVELLSDLYGSMGQAYFLLKKFNEAIDYDKKAIRINEENGHFPELAKYFRQISGTYAAKKDFENAYAYFTRYSELVDTLSGIEAGKKLSSLEYKYQIEQDNKISRLENEKKQMQHDEEVKKQRLVIYAAVIILLLVSVFSVFIFKQYKSKKAANFIIRQQKLETENQKTLLEEKQKEITDSIKYAKRIQQTLMPSEKYIDKILKHLKKTK